MSAVNTLFRKVRSFPKWLWKSISYGFKWWLSKQAKHSVIVWMIPGMRARIWRWCGANVGKNVCIGWEVFLDVMLVYNLKVLPISYSVKTENMLKSLGYWDDIYDFSNFCESTAPELKKHYLHDVYIDSSKNVQFNWLDKFLA